MKSILQTYSNWEKLKQDLFAASFDFYITWSHIHTSYILIRREIRIKIFQAEAVIIKDDLKIKILNPKTLVNGEDMATINLS